MNSLDSGVSRVRSGHTPERPVPEGVGARPPDLNPNQSYTRKSELGSESLGGGSRPAAGRDSAAGSTPVLGFA
jgi:hypothetical protein